MNRSVRHSAIITILAIIVSLLPSPIDLAQAQSGGGTIYLPILSNGRSIVTNLSDQLKQAVESVLISTTSALNVRETTFNNYSLTIHFTAPPEEELLDNADFEHTFNEIDVAIHNVLVAAGYPQTITYDYEIFINDQPLSQGFALESELSSDSSHLGDESANTLPDESSTIDRVSGITGKKIVISPGHGWAVRNGGWALDRGYHWGIVEDVVNHELVRILQPKLAATGATVLSAREMNLSAGNHSSGHPWWEMGSSEYVRNLGASPLIWGEYFPKGADRNVVAPPEYANLVNADMLISIHNNGGNGCGTETLYDTSNGYLEQSKRLAKLIQAKLIERLHSQWNGGWCDRGPKGTNGAYGENRRFKGPAVIVELAFMDFKSDNAALQNDQFREIAMTAIKDAVLEYYGEGGGTEPPTPPVSTFSGSPFSRLYTDQNGARLNLEICANNLPGQTVQARLSRPGKMFEIVKAIASARCITFFGINGSEALLANTPYTTRAALNQPPNDSWQIPCYSATGGRGLCDTVTTASISTPSPTFTNGSSALTIDTNSVNLKVCGDNVAGKVVYAQMWRSPDKTWNYSIFATSNCVTFSDMDGAGGTFANVDYYTVAALEPIGSSEAAQQRTACYGATGAKRLCDKVNRNVTNNNNVFVNGSSVATIDSNVVNLRVCGDNLAGKVVYAQMWRSPDKTWNYSQTASSNCVTFSDMDGAGGTFAGVSYYTVAAIEPIGSSEAAQQRTSCYAATGAKRLCDRVSR